MVLDINPQALQKIFSVEPQIYAIQKDTNPENYTLQHFENEMCRYLNLSFANAINPTQIHTAVVLPALYNTADDTLAPELFTTLQKMLGAVKMQIGENAVVFFSHQVACRLAFIQQNFANCKYILLLGTNLQSLDVQVKSGNNYYQPFDFQGYKWLMGHSLAELQTNAELKKNLWGGLKTVFGV